ncbi:hypothetical protein, partial [Escherichia coli]|uniref:hypothetical protein n=1 Tax=Escherichia coli TaxID=562 RepID=UPI0028DF9426
GGDVEAALDLAARLAAVPHPPAWRVAAALADRVGAAHLTPFALAFAPDGDDLLAVLRGWDAQKGADAAAAVVDGVVAGRG